MNKKIISVGLNINNDKVQCCNYSSSQSLFDADIVLFQPDFSGYSSSHFRHTHKICYAGKSSDELLQDTKRWQDEIYALLDAGHTIFIFLKKFYDFFVLENGRFVSFHNYKFLKNMPINTPKNGKEIKFIGPQKLKAPFEILKKYFNYECYSTDRKIIPTPIFETKNGEGIVGALDKRGNGHLFLLPAVSIEKHNYYSPEEHDTHVVDCEKFIIEIIKIDELLRPTFEEEPMPSWLKGKIYSLPNEVKVQRKIAEVIGQIAALEATKKTLHNSLIEEQDLQGLLFKNGKALENSVKKALCVLGYSVDNYNDGSLEIDLVIDSPEGDKFIGEIEGKDNKAINLEKSRQLMSNIQDYDNKFECDGAIHGILFANAFRLTPPDERVEEFTEHCLQMSNRYQYILIKTSDLFRVVKYIQETNDLEFSKQCREALRSSLGKIVKFPFPSTTAE